MYFNFNYQGSTYKADLAKQSENDVLVLFNDNKLEKQFGSSLPFYIENHSVSFNTTNRSHSALYALNSSISKAISEQWKELL